jgi:hypothetical protein
MRYNPDEDRRLTIRLEDDLREVLAAEARRQMRSLCSEIKFRLRQTLERHQARRHDTLRGRCLPRRRPSSEAVEAARR